MVGRRVLHRHKGLHDHATIYCSFAQRSGMAVIEGHGYSLRGMRYLELICNGQNWCSMCFLRRSNLPIFTPRVCNIGEYNLFNILRIGHFLSIFTRKNNKLKAPESIRWQSKTPTYSGTLGITDEPEALWEKEIVHFLGGVS